MTVTNESAADGRRVTDVVGCDDDTCTLCYPPARAADTSESLARALDLVAEGAIIVSEQGKYIDELEALVGAQQRGLEIAIEMIKLLREQLSS